MILSENGAKILRINVAESRIPLFRVDVPSSSQSIRLSSEFSGTEADYHIEMAEVFGPTNLPTGKNFCRGKVFEVLVVRDNVDSERSPFQVLTPMFKSVEYG